MSNEIWHQFERDLNTSDQNKARYFAQLFFVYIHITIIRNYQNILLSTIYSKLSAAETLRIIIQRLSKSEMETAKKNIERIVAGKPDKNNHEVLVGSLVQTLLNLCTNTVNASMLNLLVEFFADCLSRMLALLVM